MPFTHTFATLEVSQRTYTEIKRRIKKATGTNDHVIKRCLRAAGGSPFVDEVIDMHGIALCTKPKRKK